MDARVTLFEPRTNPPEEGGSFPSPFDELGPSALARQAAEVLQAELRSGHVAPDVPTSLLENPEGGKMFGVLVVRLPEGRVGFLRAFSGMLAGRWDVEGFVPPLFDREARARLEPTGEATVKGLLARHAALSTAPELLELRAAHVAQAARHTAELSALRERHEARRKQRHARRVELTRTVSAPVHQGVPPDFRPPGEREVLAESARPPARQEMAPPAPDVKDEAEQRAALHALDQESRGDKAERRRLEATHAEERQRVEPKLARLERRVRAVERLRHMVSRALMRRIHDTYAITSARGEHRLLRTLYERGQPPSGAADCAAPKLLAYAYAHGLRPLVLAEFWWGSAPPAGGRIPGAFYAACRDKCGPLLPFMLEGLQVAPPRTFSPPPSAPGALTVLFEDPWLVVIDKPQGLLSVPGREESLTDSVLTRLKARHPQATGPLLVHRLDLDTSGLLVAALDSRTHAALQSQFVHREVRKRYVAWVDGPVREDQGRIDFPMRVDLNDRPRQIHDPVHGKHAVTEWRVLARHEGRTRVAFFPLTGRTHQLRVHASHPLGLGAPIVGDRLYGRDGERLMLHAESLTFRHPATGASITFDCPAPF
ncbi:RluA family pseudouridine synthase [Myxococcus qinghaiensis]|uniref:RluA family pseudouridine synthase n=1 Tax=Myxococcus qinghaiensis TaxID=2906758 RepID=UPI0020A79D15|nr:pseudouridine synthase [Myxococcus qinghaiensis]MCP3164728.1 RluA family pseudouridine synthase [Myxococcus qinghaiensis]